MSRPALTKSVILVTILVLLLAPACKKTEEAETTAPPEARDSVEALMLTYETTISPDNQSVRFQVASDGTFVRLGNETEKWRLFDTKNRTIVFVDQTAGTATEVSYDDAITERTAMLGEVSPEGAPTATITEGPGEPDKGQPTHRVDIAVGNFTRQLILSENTLLPGEFFAMKLVTDPVDSRYASILKDVMPTLLRQNGTLLSETNTLKISDTESITATTKLLSVTMIQLSRKAFDVPDNVTLTKKGERPAEETTTTAK